MPLLGNTFTDMVHPTKFFGYLMDKSSLKGIESGWEIKSLLAIIHLECGELLSVLLSSQSVVLLEVTLFFVCFALLSMLFWIKLVELFIHLVHFLWLIVLILISFGFL